MTTREEWLRESVDGLLFDKPVRGRSPKLFFEEDGVWVETPYISEDFQHRVSVNINNGEAKFVPLDYNGLNNRVSNIKVDTLRKNLTYTVKEESGEVAVNLKDIPMNALVSIKNRQRKGNVFG